MTHFQNVDMYKYRARKPNDETNVNVNTCTCLLCLSAKPAQKGDAKNETNGLHCVHAYINTCGCCCRNGRSLAHGDVCVAGAVQGVQFFDSFIKGTALLYRKTPSKPTCVTENPKASA